MLKKLKALLSLDDVEIQVGDYENAYPSHSETPSPSEILNFVFGQEGQDYIRKELR